VILVNPNGVLFGKDGSVNAASFTASTLGISDANFMAGNMVYERNGSTAGIVNEGRITTAPGGYVALLGASVSNQGQIDTRGGNAFLGAADTIKVPVSSTGRIKLELTAADMNANVSNTGSIITQGGQVYMQALALNRAAAQIIQSGSIDTTGEQAGAVNLLADGGLIRLSGSIKANSNNGTAGGDIYIGRDKDTNVLAAVGDVRGAQLESQGGFVETSGHYLATHSVSVKAKDWLLDPSDITISNSVSSNVTGTSPADIVPNGGAGTSSIVQVSTIQNAINQGTSVTIKTTNAINDSNPSGAGNITIANALAFANDSNTNATLSLIADNGITQNAGASITTSAVAGKTGLVHISMTANGNFQGNTAASTSSQGIILNAGITTNGNVTLSGTNKNTNGSSRGVTFANNSGITANTITVTGTATGATEWNQGVFFHGTSSIRATGTGNSLISGISSSTAGAINSAVVFNDGSTVILDGGTGGLTVQGTHTVNGYGGIRFGANGVSSANPSLTTRGNVTLGTQDANNASLNAAFMVRGGSITSDAGSNLTIRGQSTGTGINFHDGLGTIRSNGGSITLNGVATSSGHGVLLNSNQVGTLNSGGNVTITGTSSGNGNSGVNFNGGNVRVFGNNVTINGTANTTSGQTSYGFRSVIGPGAGNTITAAGNLSITGAVNGAGSGTAVLHTSTSWQNLVNTYTTGGTLSITGTNNAAASNTSATITMAGVQARAGGNLTVSATTNNAATDAISIYSASYLSGGAAPGYQGGASSFVSTGGNTVIKSNQGSILIQDGVPNSVTSTAITGQNVIIDNTGGTFTGGVFTAGGGTSTRADRAGVQITDSLAGNDLHLASNTTRRTITASDTSGQIVLSGKSTSSSASSQGVRIGSTVSFVAPTTSVLGTSTASNGISTTAAITATGQIGLTGERTNASTGVGLNIGAAISTTGTSSTTTLTSTTGAVSGTGNITTAADNSGSITVNSATAGTLSGVISGGASLVKQGAGTTTLTGTNNYAGTTTISAGTLQVGSGGSTGTLGAGDVTLANGAGLAYNRNVDTVINNTISGNGTVSATITGNLDVAKTVNLSTVGNTVNLSASGNISQSAGSITATNLYLTASTGSIGSSSQRINSHVTNLAMSSAGNQFASQVNALNLAAKTTGSGNIDVITTNGTLKVTSFNGINGVTSVGTGNITLDGTADSGVGLNIAAQTIASGTGKITLKGTSIGINGTGLNIAANITGNGDVELTGITTANNRTAGTFAGVTNAGTVSAKNITLTALASDTTADVLGYYGAGGTLIATNNLTANAESRGAGVGFYMWSGKTQSGTGMSLTGITNTDSGIALDNGAQILNKVVSGSASGNLVLTGSTNSTIRAGIALIKASIENTSNGGGVQVTAAKGDIRAISSEASITNAGTGSVALSAGPASASDSGAIEGTKLKINQNGNGGVIVTTTGTGNVIAPTIINAGTGSVTLAAGTQLAAGDGTGGQVKTVSGNTISQTNATPSKTFIYTGSASNTGDLSKLGAFGTDLYLSTIGGNIQNVASNKAYTAGPMTNGANAQVMFREKLALSGSLNNGTVTYGNITDSAAVKAALQAVNPTTGGDNVISSTASAGTFKILKADLIVDMIAGKPSVDAALGVTANISRSGNLKANDQGYEVDLAANNFNLTNVTAKLVVAKKDVTLADITASNKTYDGTTSANMSANVNGQLTGDVVNVSGLTGNFASKNVARDVSGNVVAQVVNFTGSGVGLVGDDSANYKLSAPVSQSTTAAITPRVLNIGIGSVADKTVDGNTSAAVTPGALSNLVAGESLSVVATGNFSDATAGTGKVVTATYTLQNGTNGLASNYALNATAPNPDSRLRGNIVARVNPVNPVSPFVPVNNNKASRVIVPGSGSSGAATGVLDDQALTENASVCSDLTPENCECLSSVIPTIEICFAPMRVVANKEEK
jgi:hypothetical protein